MVGNKLNVEKVTNALALSNANNPWGGYITNTISNCMAFLQSTCLKFKKNQTSKILRTGVSLPLFIDGKVQCNGEALLLLQCSLVGSLNVTDFY
jgi:hypothetical protein